MENYYSLREFKNWYTNPRIESLSSQVIKVGKLGVIFIVLTLKDADAITIPFPAKFNRSPFLTVTDNETTLSPNPNIGIGWTPYMEFSVKGIAGSATILAIGEMIL